MSNIPNYHLKTEDLEGEAKKIFLKSLKEYRAIYKKKYSSEPEIDSEVSLFIHGMLSEFDNYRNNVK